MCITLVIYQESLIRYLSLLCMLFFCTAVLTRIILAKIWATFLYVTCSLCSSTLRGLTLFKKCFVGCSNNSLWLRRSTTDWSNQIAALWDYVMLERLAWHSRARVYLCSKRRLKIRCLPHNVLFMSNSITSDVPTAWYTK